MKRILVVTDDAATRRSLRRVLEKAGYAVEVRETGEAALRLLVDGTIDLLVLDWMLPDADGLEVLKRLRADARDTRVIFLWCRTGLDDPGAPFDAGADDLLVKPWEPDELLVRIGVALRRRREWPRMPDSPLVIDPVQRTVRFDDRDIHTTRLQFEILRVLRGANGAPVSRVELLERAWGMRGDIQTNAVDVQIGEVRRALGAEAWCIETVRGIGYRLRNKPDDRERSKR